MPYMADETHTANHPHPRKERAMTTTSKILIASLLLALSGACAATDETPSIGDTSAEATTRAHFDVWATNGKFFFHVVAGNGEVMLASQAYGSRTSALNGVLSVLDNGVLASRYQVFTGADGQSYVRLRAANNQTIATTEGYTTPTSARRAVATCVAAVSSYVEDWATATGARYEVFEGADRAFYFNLRAKNGATVLRSQGYASEAAALNGAFAVADLGVASANYVVSAAEGGGFYLSLRAANHEVVATSEVYSSKSNAVRARDAIVALIPSVDLL